MSLIGFGRNTLKNLLSTDFLVFKKVIISEEKKLEYRQFLSIFNKKGIPYEILEKEKFYRFATDKKHQGIIAFLEDYNYFSLSGLIEKFSYKKNPFFVMIDSIEDPHNFGAIIRSCAAFGVDGIIMLNKNQVPVNSTVLKVSTGGLSHVPICRVDSLSTAIKSLKLKGFLTISTICKDEIGNFDNFDFDKLYKNPKCVIFGNEHSGIRNKLIRESDYFLSIPLKNEMNSLNVSVSVGVIVSFLKKLL